MIDVHQPPGDHRMPVAGSLERAVHPAQPQGTTDLLIDRGHAFDVPAERVGQDDLQPLTVGNPQALRGAWVPIACENPCKAPGSSEARAEKREAVRTNPETQGQLC